MGGYKEKHGKTRIGNFLKGVKGIAPDILNLAGNITGMDVLKNIGKAIKNDPNISEYDKETARQLLEMDIQEMKDVTKRWEADMVSDSWMSKNIRPYTLGFLTIMLCVVMFIDSTEYFDFEVKPEYIDLLKALLITVYFAYFGSRGYEKAQKIKSKWRG